MCFSTPVSIFLKGEFMKTHVIDSRMFKTLCLVAALVSATTTANAAIIVMDAATANGSFGSPNAPVSPGYQNPLAPTGWTVGGNTGNQGLGLGGVDAGQSLYWNAPSGANGADFISRGNLYTVAAAGEQVSMTYYIGGNGNGDNWILGALSLDGTNVVDTNFVYASNVTLGGTGSLQTLNYTTLAGDVGKALGVYFNFTGNNGAAQGHLDVVTVEVTPVPEPSSLAMLAVGSLFLGLIKRRRK
jgi:hypothetical protein